MDDTTESGEQKLKAGGGKTLSLKRTVDSGPARQSLASGRTKSVVVEKKRKRTFKPGETPRRQVRLLSKSPRRPSRRLQSPSRPL